MKDYSLNKEQRKMFILKYEIVDENIILHLASGEKYSIPYSEENEKEVLRKMELQVKNVSYEFKEKNDKNFKRSIINIATSVFWIALFGGFLITGFSSNEPVSYYAQWAALGLNNLSLVLNIAGVCSYKKIKNDIEKSEFFFKNAEILNKNIDKSNILINVSKETISKIEETSADRCVFDINSIDSMSLRDLKTIKYNIERRNNFGFQENEQVKKRVLKPGKDNN